MLGALGAAPSARGRGRALRRKWLSFLSAAFFWRFQHTGPAYPFVQLIPTHLMFFAATVKGVFRFKFPVVSCYPIEMQLTLHADFVSGLAMFTYQLQYFL